MPGIYNMKNSNVPAKSRGVVLFAYNTNTVNYVKIADLAARLIRHQLGLPVTLVTDETVDVEHIDQIVLDQNTFTNYRAGYGQNQQWRNGGRYRAYELSPYDETLLIDSDYLQLDTSLLTILDSIDDYRIVTQNQSPTASMDSNMGVLGMPYVWATAVAFKKSKKSQALFELVGRIQRNYSYYQKLYQIRERNYRNDYAFSIADNIVNGYRSSLGIPWSMLTIDKPITSIEIKENKLVIRESDQAHVIPIQNLHIIDKDYLISNNFKQLIETLCQN